MTSKHDDFLDDFLKGRPPQALFCDFDGTLVDTMAPLYQAYLQFLKKRGKEGSRCEFLSLCGPSLQEVVANLKKKYGFQEEGQALFSSYIEEVSREQTKGADFFPGALTFLQTVKERQIPIALVTSAYHSYVDRFLQAKGAFELFDVIITADDVSQTKPSPEGYEKAFSLLSEMKKLSDRDQPLEKARCLVLEDSVPGATAAIAAGLPLIWMDHQPSAESQRERESLPEKVAAVVDFAQLQAQLFKEN